MLTHFSHVQLFVTLWTVAHQTPLSMGFSRQEYWSGMPCPAPGNKLYHYTIILASVQFSRSVMSDSLWPHQSQHTRPPCPSPTPGVYSNSCPLSRWCHPVISSSVIPFSSCPQDQGLFQWVNSSHQVAKVLEFKPQHQSFQWKPRTDLL